MPATLPTLAVFASGNGSNFEALVEAEGRGELGGRIAVLLCDRPDAGALARARRLGVPALTPPAGRFRTKLEDERPWLDALRERGVEVVLLAGFMRRLHATLLDAYPDRILNIHPSLLPRYPGLDAVAQALYAGERTLGCTVHLVNERVDEGAILGAESFERRDGDTLETILERVHAAEHRLYPRCVRHYLAEPWRKDGARIVWGEGAGYAGLAPLPRAHGAGSRA